MTEEESIRQLKKRHSVELMRMPGVCGVGVEKDDQGRYALTVHLDSGDPSVRKDLPESIEGHTVRYVHSGPFRKLTT